MGAPSRSCSFPVAGAAGLGVDGMEPGALPGQGSRLGDGPPALPGARADVHRRPFLGSATCLLGKCHPHQPLMKQLEFENQGTERFVKVPEVTQLEVREPRFAPGPCDGRASAHIGVPQKWPRPGSGLRLHGPFVQGGLRPHGKKLWGWRHLPAARFALVPSRGPKPGPVLLVRAPLAAAPSPPPSSWSCLPRAPGSGGNELPTHPDSSSCRSSPNALTHSLSFPVIEFK